MGKRVTENQASQSPYNERSHLHLQRYYLLVVLTAPKDSSAPEISTLPSVYFATAGVQAGLEQMAPSAMVDNSMLPTPMLERRSNCSAVKRAKRISPGGEMALWKTFLRIKWQFSQPFEGRRRHAIVTESLDQEEREAIERAKGLLFSVQEPFET